jgi:2-polyprenyl-3-methyl-5-hydroxy-6-metoxy-1,4-benzoquinol methylase
MDLKETSILGSDIDAHWYYYSKAKAMMRLLDGSSLSKVLDVGAGSGFFSRQLLKYSSAEEAWCVDISYDTDSDSHEAGKALYSRRSIDSVKANLVLFMDVLEHVDDDVELLKIYITKVPRNSRFLISVPAFQFLWSGHDDFLGHKRRYTLNKLDKVVRNAGLKVEYLVYYFGIVFPIAAILRLSQNLRHDKNDPRSQLTRHHPIVNGTLKALCYSELPLMMLNRFAGLTIFCLAKSI